MTPDHDLKELSWQYSLQPDEWGQRHHSEWTDALGEVVRLLESVVSFCGHAKMNGHMYSASVSSVAKLTPEDPRSRGVQWKPQMKASLGVNVPTARLPCPPRD